MVRLNLRVRRSVSAGWPAAKILGLSTVFVGLSLVGCSASGLSLSPTPMPMATATESPAEPTLDPTAPPVTESPGPMATSSPVPFATGPETDAIRIEFPAGGSGATIEGMLQAGEIQRYVLHAFAGQIMRVYVEPLGSELRIFGADGTELSGKQDYYPFWRGELPSTQEYVIEFTQIPSTIDPSGAAHRLDVVIVPPGQATMQLEHRDVAHGFELAYSDYFAVGQPPEVYDGSGEQVLVSLTFTGSEYFQDTNLAEVSAVVSTHGIEPGGDCVLPSFSGSAGPAVPVEVGGMRYLKMESEGIAAGNFYELISHSAAHGDACYSVTFYIHSTSVAAYADPSRVSEFDRAGVTRHLEDVLTSLRFIEG